MWATPLIDLADALIAAVVGNPASYCLLQGLFQALIQFNGYETRPSGTNIGSFSSSSRGAEREK